jgi:bifunctional NMN adenylyltransferase/nudix hydrolase
MTYDFLAFIGRFQPFHLGHKHIVDSALQEAERVILLVGSANVSRSVRNPFTFEERHDMIRAVFRKAVSDGRLLIVAVDDVAYNDTAWTAGVQKIVADTILKLGNDNGVVLHGLNDFKIGLAGFGKDGSSYYLKKFPEWESFDIKPKFQAFNATAIREDYFRGNPVIPRDSCPEEVCAWMADFRTTDAFNEIVKEADFIKDYKASWATAPYEPVFVTVDAVVVQSGHVLLVRRKASPGAGLLALPGGFLDPDEPLRRAVIRELREETQIADNKGPIPPAMLGSFIEDKQTRVFDNPYRSQRGRTITHAFLFQCPDRKPLFKVKGGDDAAHADWYRLGDLDPRDFFEDHWFILSEMTGL